MVSLVRLVCAFSLAFNLAGGAAELPTSRHAFTVIAHRGNHTRAQENTITALEHAVRVGADYVEIDVRRSADGVYVLMHDATVDRMTDGHGAVRQLTIAQLQALRVADPHRPEIAPDRVPLLAEILELAKGRINLYVDFKEGERSEVAELIRKHGMTRQVIVYDEIPHIPEWRRIAPEIALIISPPKGAASPDNLVAFVKKSGVEILDGDWTFYTREMVAALKPLGVAVWPDIQEAKEDAAYFQRVRAVGFTGAQTDHPEELLAWLKAQRNAPQASAP
jgi:glycerophosphoryl diester phosphodiesterase